MGAQAHVGGGGTDTPGRWSSPRADRRRRPVVPIARTHPLAEAAEALRASEAGHVGGSSCCFPADVVDRRTPVAATAIACRRSIRGSGRPRRRSPSARRENGGARRGRAQRRRHGADECAAVCAALAPDEAAIERVPARARHAQDLVLRLRGGGTRRALLVGHVHRRRAQRAPAAAAPGRATAWQRQRGHEGRRRARPWRAARLRRAPELYDARAAAVCDEEWWMGDSGHVERFAGFDACLCFEAGELRGDAEGVVVRRKAAGTVHVTAHGRSAHSGSPRTAGATRCRAGARRPGRGRAA